MNTIVLPTSSCSRMTSFCMSRRISGSSAENGSSNSSSVGVAGQRAGQADALLHAAGQLVGVGGLVAGEADQLEHLLRPRPALGLAHAADLEPEGHVVDDGRCGSRPKCWNTIATWLRRRSRSCRRRHAVTSSPSIATVPAVGSISRVRQRTSVDLPEPDRPITTKTSPGRDLEGDVLDAAAQPVLLRSSLRDRSASGVPMILSAWRRRSSRGPT